MKKIITKNRRCIICGNQDLIRYLSLGKTALANSYLSQSQLTGKELKVPLEVYYCSTCHLSQLVDIVNPRMLFENYAYFSSASPQLIKHFEYYAKEVFRRYPQLTKKLVLEVASNDGILLKFFKQHGARVLGIDPAKNIAKIANQNGVETIPRFFSTALATKILKKYGQASIITANNVLAHTSKLRDIIAGVKNLLAQDGVFVFQVKYLVDLLEKNEFDTIYHEHISYFSLLPLMRLFNDYELEIFDVKHVETEGGSIRIYAGNSPLIYKKLPRLKKLYQREKKLRLDHIQVYKKFAQKPPLVRNKLMSLLNKLKQEKVKIAGYGASAKGNTLLQYCGINNKTLDYIIDSAPFKQGKYTPGTHIPIYHPDYLKKEVPDYILLLAWNFGRSIIDKEAWFRSHGGKFIIPIPSVRIV